MKGILLLAVFLIPTIARSQPDLRESIMDTIPFGWSRIAAFHAGAGETEWHFGMTFGPIVLEFSGDFWKWEPPESQQLQPMPWFEDDGEKRYMKKSLCLGAGVHSFGTIFLYAGPDFSWIPYYRAHVSGASGAVWYTGPRTEFRVGYWCRLLARVPGTPVAIGAGYGDIRGWHGSLAFGFF